VEDRKDAEKGECQERGRGRAEDQAAAPGRRLPRRRQARTDLL
jgi:hypothetical protein